MIIPVPPPSGRKRLTRWKCLWLSSSTRTGSAKISPWSSSLHNIRLSIKWYPSIGTQCKWPSSQTTCHCLSASITQLQSTNRKNKLVIVCIKFGQNKWHKVGALKFSSSEFSLFFYPFQFQKHHEKQANISFFSSKKVGLGKFRAERVLWGTYIKWHYSCRNSYLNTSI